MSFRSWLLMLVIACTGGLCGAALVRWFDEPATGSVSPESTSKQQAMANRLARLEQRVQALQLGLLALRSVPGLAEQAKSDTDPAALDTAVRTVLQRMQQEKAEQREERRAEKDRRRAEELAASLAPSLLFTDLQREETIRILIEDLDRRRELREALNRSDQATPMTDREKKERRDAITKQVDERTEAELGRVLDPAQLARFVEHRNQQRNAPDDE